MTPEGFLASGEIVAEKKKDTTKAARCLMDATDMPPYLFALATDGRKNFHQCRSRKALFQVLAKSADPDGAAACPSIETMMEKTGDSRMTIHRRLNELETLGFAVRGGLHTFYKTRIWSLHLPTAPVPDSSEEPKAPVSDSSAPVSDSPSNPANLIHNRPTAVLTAQPTALPTVQGWWKEFSQKTATMDELFGAVASDKQKAELHVQAQRCGDDLLLAALNEWIVRREMPVDTLRQKWAFWFRECEPFLTRAIAAHDAAVQKANDDAYFNAVSLPQQNAEIIERWAVKPRPAEENPEDFFK